ncbi:GTP cyclohydrolase II [Nocardia sp. CA-084685]|uniref:GTP cyclohydrolase II n=1 Tax=Nocardia sp. CA-084685 TaxID=3239970 RepID=UPI003D95F4E6
MTTAVPTLGETAHRLTRKGQDLQVRVMEVAGGAEYGHVLVFGEADDGCLVRVHSRCLYGEGLGSDDCDCGPELDKSLDLIWAEGRGVLVYLEQEGRGVGLIAKALGYRESQQSGADTFTSYERLGFPADSRSYLHAAKSLQDLGLTRVRLLTNNPDKVAELRAAGLTVIMEPLLTTALSARAAAYLESKRRRRGHLIPTGEVPWAPDVQPVLKRKSRIWRIFTIRGPVRRARRRAAQPALPASK